MPYSVIVGAGLGSEATTAILTSLEWALEALGLADRTDPLTMIVANKLIELAKEGVRDPQRLCELTLQAIRAGAADTQTLRMQGR